MINQLYAPEIIANFSPLSLVFDIDEHESEYIGKNRIMKAAEMILHDWEQ